MATADKVSDLLVAGQVGILVLDVMALHEPASVSALAQWRYQPVLRNGVAAQRARIRIRFVLAS